MTTADTVLADEAPDWGLPDNGDDARTERDQRVKTVVDAVVVLGCALFVFFELHASHLLSSAVPAGGDMGAHVWGPAFLRDELLPNLRLSGWTQAWYDGFPAYQFYMVIPSLVIVLLDVGLFSGALAVVPLAAAGLVGAAAYRAGPGTQRRWLVLAAVAVLIIGIDLPYGTAFKLVSVSGLVGLPAAAYVFGRLAQLPFPVPAVLSAATLPFLFNRNFSIWGGNVASTLAGEFAFSISLSLAIVYLGLVIRGVRTGRHRALGAVLIALTGLCHIIPAFFALGATAVIAVFHLRKSTFVWLATTLPVGGLLSAFWVLPFWWQRAYVNDMGWEKIPYQVASNDYSHRLSETLFSFGGETYWRYLVPTTGALPEGVPGSPFADDMRWVLGLAVAGVVLSIAFRVRVGLMIATWTVCTAVAFVALPEGRLWNARVLPFYYLGLYLLAGVAIALAGRTIAQLWTARPQREAVAGEAATAIGAFLVTVVLVAMPLGTLPLGLHRSDGTYAWFGFEVQSSYLRSWARWNYSGYEGKQAYAEYRDVMLTMEALGESNGCGRAFWEYDKEQLDRYGTSMALMLMPHFTEGCIGSQEGLYFEASATTPFHFLVQAELSAKPSSAQRDLPYGSVDVDRGVRHLQILGVKYFMTLSDEVTTAATQNDDLTKVAETGPWTVFEVAQSQIVAPLRNQPVVLDGVDDAQHDWICRTTDEEGDCAGPAVEWFTDPSRWPVMLASSGPEDWERVSVDNPRPVEDPLPAVEVADIEIDENRIAFDVDRPGVPVLVKASYFPNWEVQGGEGPYRVAPNLMVVVPTEEHVELVYGREPIEWAAWLLTVAGIALVVLLARSKPLDVPDDPDLVSSEPLGPWARPADPMTDVDLGTWGRTWSDEPEPHYPDPAPEDRSP